MNLCNRCKKAKIEIPFFMLKDKIWYSIARENEILCFNCISIRLGRDLMLSDFQPRCKVGGKFHNFWRKNFKKSDDLRVIIKFLRLMENET